MKMRHALANLEASPIYVALRMPDSDDILQIRVDVVNIEQDMIRIAGAGLVDDDDTELVPDGYAVHFHRTQNRVDLFNHRTRKSLTYADVFQVKIHTTRSY